MPPAIPSSVSEHLLWPPLPLCSTSSGSCELSHPISLPQLILLSQPLAPGIPWKYTSQTCLRGKQTSKSVSKLQSFILPLSSLYPGPQSHPQHGSRQPFLTLLPFSRTEQILDPSCEPLHTHP